MYPDNPNLELPTRNIFTVRKENYDQIMDDIAMMLEVPLEHGFTLEQFEKRPARYNNFNLMHTIKENLVLKLNKNGNLIDLTMQIPKLVNDQWIVINNRKKIPRYQLYDVPILPLPDKNELRILTNVGGNVSIYWKYKKRKTEGYIGISALSKKISFAVVLCAFYGPDYVKNNFLSDVDDLKNIAIPDMTPYQLLQTDLIECCDVETPIEAYVELVGESLGKTNAVLRGEDFIYLLKTILRIDVITKRFIKEDNIVDCIMHVLKNNFLNDDIDYANKRIRCFEYIILRHYVQNIFKLCMTNRDNDNPKYNINKTKILSECNVSEIVQFDFCINPISQLTQMTQTSLTGPDGFKKDSIPTKLKDLHYTMLGKLCPVDTPDRDNCGVVQNLNPTVKFDERFKFIEEGYKKNIPSISVSMVPFLEHTDQTRLQMAASQMRQSILLNKFHVPYVCSGVEKQFTKYTDFVYKAKEDGEVLYRDNRMLIVGYKSGKVQIYHIGVKPIISGNMDMIICDLKTGDEFERDSLLAYSTFCKNEMITIGQNFKIAFMSYYGYNNEDGIVISDRLVNDDCLTSCHYVDMSFNVSPTKVLMNLLEDESKYMPIPQIDTRLQKGDIYAKIKDMYTLGSTKNDTYTIFEEGIEKISPYDLRIENINIYANDWYRGLKEYDAWVQKNIAHQKKKVEKIIQVIADNTDLNDGKHIIKENKLDTLTNVGKFKLKDELIKGIRIEINGVYDRKIKVGDKLANRHGNKGVITSIVKHNDMPQLPNGDHVDICLNPMGVISRMNVGQLFEVSLSQSLVDFKKILRDMCIQRKPQKEIKKKIIEYISLTDKTPEKWITLSMKNSMPEEIDIGFINDFYLIQPQFDSINLDDIYKIMEYTNSKFEVKLYDPISKKHILTDIAVGYMYLMKLTHIAENKLSYRSIGITSKKTMQPVSGKRNNGGQRCGEMETGCLISNDMPVNHREFFTVKSDCIDGKNNFLKNEIGTDYLDLEDDPDLEPETLKLLKANLQVLGIDISEDI